MSSPSVPAVLIFLRYLKIFLITITVFCCFSIFSSLIPEKPVMQNIEKSIDYMENAPNYPETMIKGDQFRLDYAMDGLIANMIYTIDNQEPLRSAFMGRSRANPVTVNDQWKNAAYSTTNKTLEPNFAYARYWHGSTFFFRIFFSFTHYNEVKWIIFLLTSLLMTGFGIMLYQNTGSLKTLAMFAGLFFVNVYVMQFSMQLSPVLIISIVSCLVLSSRHNKVKAGLGAVFFITGAVTSYFDLLTAPYLTLGLPLLLWISLYDEKNQQNLLQGIRIMVTFSLLWLVGYAGSWAMKWVISNPFTEFDLFSDVHQQLMLRAGTLENSRFLALQANFKYLPLVFINLFLTIPLILSLFFFNRKGVNKAVLYLIAAVLPYFWFYAAADHSYVHNWYTYRIQAISVSGVLLAAISLVEWERIRLKRKKSLTV